MNSCYLSIYCKVKVSDMWFLQLIKHKVIQEIDKDCNYGRYKGSKSNYTLILIDYEELSYNESIKLFYHFVKEYEYILKELNSNVEIEIYFNGKEDIIKLI